MKQPEDQVRVRAVEPPGDKSEGQSGENACKGSGKEDEDGPERKPAGRPAELPAHRIGQAGHEVAGRKRPTRLRSGVIDGRRQSRRSIHGRNVPCPTAGVKPPLMLNASLPAS